MLRITRYAAGEAPQTRFEDAFGMMVGERQELPGLEWDLELEHVGEDVASFLLQPARTAPKATPSV